MSTAKQPLPIIAAPGKAVLARAEPTAAADPAHAILRANPRVALPEGLIDLGVLRRADRTPMRLRRNGRQKKAVQLYFSVKMKAHVPCESLLELHDMWRAEVQSNVLSYAAQPYTIKFMLNGEKRSYTPDRQDVLDDESVVVTQIKDDVGGSPDPGEADTLEAAKLLLARRGLTFEVRRRSKIYAQPFFDAYELIQHHRRTQVLAEEAYLVKRSLWEGARPFREVQNNLGGGPLGMAKTYALMVRGVLKIDISAGLHPDALVSAMRSP